MSPKGFPEGIVGSISGGCLIQPIWLHSDSISEEGNESSLLLNSQVWEH